MAINLNKYVSIDYHISTALANKEVLEIIDEK